MRLVIPLVLLLSLAFPAVYGAEPVCRLELYFSPQDRSLQKPMARPHPDFQRTLTLARTGDLTAQVTIGHYYSGAYLVTQCLEKASYWYKQAAAQGDKVAQNWLLQQPTEAELRRAQECAEESCAFLVGNFQPVRRSSRPSSEGNRADASVGSACVAPDASQMNSADRESYRERYQQCLKGDLLARSNPNSACKAPGVHDLQSPSGAKLLESYQECLKKEQVDRAAQR